MTWSWLGEGDIQPAIALEELFVMKHKNLLCLAVLAGASGLAGTAAAEEMGSARVTAKPLARAFGADDFATTSNAAIARIVELGRPTHEMLDALRQGRALQGKHGKPLSIGMARTVERSRIDLNSLDWQTLANGSRGARFSLTSTQAVALRAGLRLRGNGRPGADPAAVSLRFAGDDGRVFGESGKAFAGDQIAWSPIVAGDTIVVEVELAPEQRPGDFTLEVPKLSHLDVDPSLSSSAITKEVGVAGIGGSQECERDVVCRVNPSPGFVAVSKAVARMAFTDTDGETSYCTGTLLNNSNTPKRHLLWSAAHCFSTQTVANSLQTYWFFDSVGCDTDTLSPSAVTVTGGAYLRYANTNRDTLLLELKNAPPAGAFYAAWNNAALTATGTAFETIHHPYADLKKYSLGTVTDTSTSYYWFTPVTEVQWNTGVGEGGSSGSGLFTVDASGEYQLRGGLVGGDSACKASGLLGPDQPDYFSQLSGVWSKVSSYFSP
jgi:hypothetical protein